MPTSSVVRFAICVALAAGLAVTSHAQTAMEHLEALGRTLRSHPGWTATYHQEFLPVGMTVPEETDGIVWVAWPDRAQFRAGHPEVRRLGLEGRVVRLVDFEMSSCDDHTLSDDEWARIPLAPILDPSVALDRFTVIDVEGIGFALVPRDPGGVARLEVEMGPDRLPVRVVILDPQGTANRLVFSDWTPAVEPPGGEWLPQPPVGVECIDDGS